MLGVVLQARLDSSRLPGKSLMPLGGKPLIVRVMEALNRIPADIRVLACPEDSLKAFTEAAAVSGFVVIAGPKDDVLARYCLALRRFGIRHLIRATGDNPFVFADAAEALNAEAVNLGAEYAGYSGLPHGAGVESVSADSLLKADAHAAAAYEREHVCPHLYNHPEQFRLHRPLAPLYWQGPDIRLTVDTLEDYERARLLYAELDSLENSGELRAGERYRGAAIISAYRKIFPAANGTMP